MFSNQGPEGKVILSSEGGMDQARLQTVGLNNLSMWYITDIYFLVLVLCDYIRFYGCSYEISEVNIS